MANNIYHPIMCQMSALSLMLPKFRIPEIRIFEPVTNLNPHSNK